MNRDTFSFKEEDQKVILTVDTLVPTKWLLIDRETGQVYQGSSQGYWDKLKTIERDNK
jgi:hypothetical protein